MSVDIGRFLGDGIGERTKAIKSIQFVMGNARTFSANTVHNLTHSINSEYAIPFLIQGIPSRMFLTDTTLTTTNEVYGPDYGSEYCTWMIVEFEPSGIKQMISGRVEAVGRGFSKEYNTQYFDTNIDVSKSILFIDNALDINESSGTNLAFGTTEFASDHITGYWEVIGGSFTSNTTKGFNFKIIEFY